MGFNKFSIRQGGDCAPPNPPCDSGLLPLPEPLTDDGKRLYALDVVLQVRRTKYRGRGSGGGRGARGRRLSEGWRIHLESSWRPFSEVKLLLALLGWSWLLLGRSCDALGFSWSFLGRSWEVLGLSWVAFWRSWGVLGWSWGVLGSGLVAS